MDPTSPAVPPVRQIAPAELKSLLESGTAFELVDVRTEHERETPIVFQCHHGIRSQGAADYFRAQGFRNLQNLAGGIEAWSREVDPSVPRY